MLKNKATMKIGNSDPIEIDDFKLTFHNDLGGNKMIEENKTANVTITVVFGLIMGFALVFGIMSLVTIFKIMSVVDGL